MRLVTANELDQHPEWGPYELVRGKVIQTCLPVNAHAVIQIRLGSRLDAYSESTLPGKCWARAAFRGSVIRTLSADPIYSSSCPASSCN